MIRGNQTQKTLGVGPAATVGERLATLRKQAAMTQEQLAQATGLTRQHISALEVGGRLQRTAPTILKALAEGLEIDVRQLVKGTAMAASAGDEPLDEDTGGHLVYCPNSLCSRNKIHASPAMTYRVEYKSLQALGRAEWAQVDFCGHCGERLIKACPRCGKRIRQAPEYFCCRCGHPVDDRPTDQERQWLRNSYGRCEDSFPPRRPPAGPTGPARPTTHMDRAGNDASASLSVPVALDRQHDTPAIRGGSDATLQNAAADDRGSLPNGAPLPPGWADGEGPAPLGYILAHLPQPDTRGLEPLDEQAREHVLKAGLVSIQHAGMSAEDLPMCRQAWRQLKELRQRRAEPDAWPGTPAPAEQAPPEPQGPLPMLDGPIGGGRLGRLTAEQRRGAGTTPDNMDSDGNDASASLSVPAAFAVQADSTLSQSDGPAAALDSEAACCRLEIMETGPDGIDLVRCVGPDGTERLWDHQVLRRPFRGYRDQELLKTRQAIRPLLSRRSRGKPAPGLYALEVKAALLTDQPAPPAHDERPGQWGPLDWQGRQVLWGLTLDDDLRVVRVKMPADPALRAPALRRFVNEGDKEYWR